MRFMMLMIPKGYEKATPGTVPDAKAVEAMMKYNEALQNAGVLLALDGLHPPSMGARVSFPGRKPKVTDGPFAEAKEVIGGYWMIEVKSKEYVEGDWTNHERQSAVARAINERGKEYILPVKIEDDVELPGVPTTIGYVSLKTYSVDQIAQMLISKLNA